MKMMWKLDKNNGIDNADQYSSEDLNALKLILYTIKEAESALFIENSTKNTAVNIFLEKDTIIVVEKENAIEKQLATWVPTITFAIGAIHKFLNQIDDCFLIKGTGNELLDKEYKGQNESKLKEIENDCIKWLAYEHKNCLMKGREINGAI